MGLQKSSSSSSRGPEKGVVLSEVWGGERERKGEAGGWLEGEVGSLSLLEASPDCLPPGHLPVS